MDDSFDSSAPFMPRHESDHPGEEPIIGHGHSMANSIKEYKTNGMDNPTGRGEAFIKKRRNRVIGITAIAVTSAIVIAVVIGSVLGNRSNKKNFADGLQSNKGTGSAADGAKGKSGKLWGVGGDTIKVSHMNAIRVVNQRMACFDKTKHFFSRLRMDTVFSTTTHSGGLG